MKTFMDFLSEATMDMVHPPEVASPMSPLHQALNDAFPSGKVKGGGKFVVSGTKDLRGHRVGTAIGFVQGGDHSRWQDMKRAIDTEISRFPAFEHDEIRRGKMPFINSEDPIVDVGKGGNVTLTWYRPHNSFGNHDQWAVPKVPEKMKQTG